MLPRVTTNIDQRGRTIVDRGRGRDTACTWESCELESPRERERDIYIYISVGSPVLAAISDRGCCNYSGQRFLTSFRNPLAPIAR
jgi:hypothetical protein